MGLHPCDDIFSWNKWSSSVKTCLLHTTRIYSTFPQVLFHRMPLFLDDSMMINKVCHEIRRNKNVKTFKTARHLICKLLVCIHVTLLEDLFWNSSFWRLFYISVWKKLWCLTFHFNFGRVCLFWHLQEAAAHDRQWQKQTSCHKTTRAKTFLKRKKPQAKKMNKTSFLLSYRHFQKSYP